MKLNLNFYLKNIDGTESAIKANEVVANVISGLSKLDGFTPVRAFEICSKLQKGEEVELLGEDTKNLMKGLDGISILAKGQIFPRFEGNQ